MSLADSHNVFIGNGDNDFFQIKDPQHSYGSWSHAIGVRGSDSVLRLSTSFTGYRSSRIEDNLPEMPKV